MSAETIYSIVDAATGDYVAAIYESDVAGFDAVAAYIHPTGAEVALGAEMDESHSMWVMAADDAARIRRMVAVS